MIDRKRRRLIAGFGAVAGAGLLGAWWRLQRRPAATGAVTTLLRDGEQHAGFARVTGPRAFEFPRDHAAHPAFRHEWWYFTGHLADDTGRDYGFQLTFFRYALRPEPPDSPSRWRTRDIVLAHFALTDVGAGRFHHATRRARAALGLAGADEAAPRVWIRDWRVALDGAQRWQLAAAAEQHGLSLELTARKPVVLQGDEGYSPKSAAPGNASHYYSQPRLDAAGSVVVAGERRAVRGGAWLDREWGTSALGREQVGWDWFALQLEDGRELTFYRLRTTAGATDGHSRGLLVKGSGAATPLPADAVDMTPLRWWRSPVTGLRYPLDWRVTVPSLGLDLELRARVDAQEWTGDLRYWEGQVAVKGQAEGQHVRGLGYLELTGYG